MLRREFLQLIIERSLALCEMIDLIFLTWDSKVKHVTGEDLPTRVPKSLV